MSARKNSENQASIVSDPTVRRVSVPQGVTPAIVRRVSSSYRTSILGSEGLRSKSELVSRWKPDSTKVVLLAITRGEKFPSFVGTIDVEFGGATAQLVDLRGIDFRELKLEGVDLSYCALDYCRIDHAKFTDIQIQYSRLCGASLNRSILLRMQASPLDAAGAHFDGVQIKDSFLQGSSFRGANFSGTRFIDCIVGESEGLHSSLLEEPLKTAVKEKFSPSLKKTLIGKVISDKRAKTVTVLVERRVRHALYNKIVAKSSTYHVHDENGTFKRGDVVEIAEVKPISKSKSWTVKRLVSKATIL